MFDTTSSKKRIIPRILAVLIIGFGALYVVYTDIAGTATDKSDNGVDTKTGTSTEADVLGTDIIIEPAENDPTIPIPDLNQSVVFYTELPSASQDIYRKQIQNITDVLKSDSSLFNSWIELGGLRKAIGDHEGAREIWEYVGILSPENNVSFFNLGDLHHFYLKDYAKAEKNFLIAKDNNLLYVPVYRALFELYTLSYKQNTSAAEDTLFEGLHNNPNNLDLTVLLAGYYKGKGDTANARIYYEKALTEAQRLDNESMIKLLEEELKTL